MFRLRSAVALAAAVCLVSPGVSQSAPTFTWAGTWTIDANTCCGKTPVPMTLDASGNGSYSFCGGTISGAQISGNTLKGTWTQQAGCANVAETSGAVEFDLATSGKSFSGHWRYASHSSWDGPWDGTCTGGACLNNHAEPSTRSGTFSLHIESIHNRGSGGYEVGTSSDTVEGLPVRLVLTGSGSFSKPGTPAYGGFTRASGSILITEVFKKNGRYKTYIAKIEFRGGELMPVGTVDAGTQPEADLKGVVTFSTIRGVSRGKWITLDVLSHGEGESATFQLAGLQEGILGSGDYWDIHSVTFHAG